MHIAVNDPYNLFRHIGNIVIRNDSERSVLTGWLRLQNF